MLERTPSRPRLRGLLIALAVIIIALVVLNVTGLVRVRDVLSRFTLPVQRALREAGTGLRNVAGGVGELASLQERNEELEQEVARLTIENVRLSEVEAENARLRDLLNFAAANPGYDIKGSQVVGRVVAEEPLNLVESIVIDLGSIHGIGIGMPVVTDRGLVGRISHVYSTTARVLLITDSNSSLNVVLQNARLRGILRGRGSLPVLIDYLPQDQPMTVGDIVVTSGEGGNFPAGIPVGQVMEIERNDIEMFQRAILRTTVDFNSLETVLVITNFAPLRELESQAGQ